MWKPTGADGATFPVLGIPSLEETEVMFDDILGFGSKAATEAAMSWVFCWVV
jgi:hypothetical protein